MKKVSFIYIILTLAFIFICFKIKDDYYYLPYPNAIEFLLGVVLLMLTFILLLFKGNKKQKLLMGTSSVITLFFSVNLMNYFFEWHPLNLTLPFSKSQSFEVDYEPYQWDPIEPYTVPYDISQEIEQYLHKIDGWKRLRSLVVIKDGRVMIEKYQNGATKYSAFNVHSITKSIISSLTGIAIKKGYLKSENELVMPYFEEYNTGSSNDQILKIEHLLSMKGGFKGWDGPQGVKEVIAEGFSNEKTGKDFKYYTGSQMLLSAILTKTTNIPTKDFAERELFQPLGVKCGFWRKVDGYYSGGDETYFTARDLARFGYLYLNQGNIEGNQLMDTTWISKSFSNYTLENKAFRELGCYKETGYGYCWWLLNYNNKIIYTARGKGGQYILIIPDENIVVVILQEWNLQKDFSTENGYLCDLLSVISSNSIGGLP